MQKPWKAAMISKLIQRSFLIVPNVDYNNNNKQ